MLQPFFVLVLFNTVVLNQEASWQTARGGGGPISLKMILIELHKNNENVNTNTKNKD